MIRFVPWFLILSLIVLNACAVQPALPELPSPSPPPAGPAAVWERSGGIAGICQRLTIQTEGSYELLDCAAQRQVGAGELSVDQLQRLQAFLSQYSAHQYKVIPPASSADMFTDSYILYGQGFEKPTAEEQMEINEYFAGLAGVLAPVPESQDPPPTGGPASGIEGGVWLGPTCPGPARQDAPECADRPYRAEIAILDSSGDLVARTKSGQSGHFKLALPTGEYVLRPESPAGSRLPRASEQRVTVTEGQYAQVEIRYDTGIR